MEPSGWTDSPYVGICIRPRATIRAIVDRDPTDRVILLVLIAAVVVALTNAIHGYNYNPTAFAIGGKPIPEIPPHTAELMKLWTLAGMVLLAVPFLYVNGVLLRWTGSLFGGTAKAVEVRAAIGWASVASIVLALFYFIEGFLVLPPPQPHEPQSMSSLVAYMRSALPSMIVSSPFTLWAWTVKLKCLGEVHRFSAWRALWASLLGYFIWAATTMVAFFALGSILRFLPDSPLNRALSLSLAVTVLLALLAFALFRKYSRPTAQS